MSFDFEWNFVNELAENVSSFLSNFDYRRPFSRNDGRSGVLTSGAINGLGFNTSVKFYFFGGRIHDFTISLVVHNLRIIRKSVVDKCLYVVLCLKCCSMTNISEYLLYSW